MAEEEKKPLEEPEETPAAEQDAPKEEAAPAEEAPKTKEEKPEKKKKASGGKNPFKSKKFKHGSLSVIFTVIFVAAIVLVNVIFNLLLDRFDIKADLTESGVYTAGEELIDFAKRDNSTLHFYFTAQRETLENADTVYKQTLALIEQLASANAKYDVSFKDLLKEPAFAEEHGVSTEGSLVIACDDTGRERSFSIAGDFCRYIMNDGQSHAASEAQMMSYYGYQVTEETSIAEQEILSAMVSITRVNPIKTAFLTGFGEEKNNTLQTLLEKNAYVVESLDIDLTDKVSEDYDILVINAPTMDYSNDALTKIDEWLSNGGFYGKNLVYIAKAYPPVTTPNINAYLEEWGLSAGEGYILQMDANYAYVDPNSGLPFFQRAEINTESEYYGAMSIGANTIFPTYYVRPIFRSFDEQSNYKTEAIVSTYGENCTFMPFDSEKELQNGQYDIIASAYKVKHTGTDVSYSRVIAAGGETLFSADFLNATNYNNAEVAVGVFNTISGNTDEQVTITPKSFTASSFELDSAQQTGIGITFAVIIPVIIIVTGIVVWVRRRRL